MHDFTYITAFTVGLLGGVHCIGMCGGIVGALGFASQQGPDGRKISLLGLLLSYNLGRIISYALAGGLMGGIGWFLSNWIEIKWLQQILQFVAAVFMLLMGFYIAGWWMVLTRVEKLGLYIWKYIQPAAQKLLPVTSRRQAVLLGLLWGWLPCGLVYSVLVWSVSTGSFQQGALLMLSFGLGTLSNLLAMGLLADQLKQFIQKQGVRYLAGGIIVIFALWNFWLVYSAIR